MTYMLARGESGISRATVRRSIQGMSTFWKWCIVETRDRNKTTE